MARPRTCLRIWLVLAAVVVATRTAGARCPDDDVTRAAVAAARAQAALACDCAGAASHGSFVACVADVARGLEASGALPRACRAAVVRCAGASTCRAPGSVTCCRTRSGVTTCRRGLAAPCTARGGVPCLGPFPACCADCVEVGCATTTTTTTTSTTLPLCSAAAAPACGGSCPPGLVCQAGQTIDATGTTRFCACVAADAPCAPLTMDCDFGVCPSGQSYTAWFALGFCGCL